MPPPLNYTIFQLGDTALTVDFGNEIKESLNERVLSLFYSLQQSPLEGMIEAVPAYSSLTLYYNVETLFKNIKTESSVFELMKNKIIYRIQEDQTFVPSNKNKIEVPVCYDKKFAPDLEWLSNYLKISAEEIIQQHCAATYRVFMLGFLPGFAYMGTVSEKIIAPRKQQPQNVVAGSVGLAGKQTGIYPLSSPGGWQIIGKTPLQLFNYATGNSLFKAGDEVRFYTINKDEFNHIKSRNS